MECVVRTKRRFQPPWQKQTQPVVTQISRNDPCEVQSPTADSTPGRSESSDADVKEQPLDSTEKFEEQIEKKEPALVVSSSSIVSLPTVVMPEATQQPQNFSAFKVLYCKRSLKKHKSYRDGVLIPKPMHSLLLSEWGATVTKAQLRVAAKPPYKESDTFVIGGFEGELYTEITHDDFLSGRCFITASACFPDAPSIPKAPSAYVPPLLLSTTTSLPSTKVIDSTKSETCLEQGSNETSKEDSRPVLASFLQGHLRPHQLEGLTWIYERIAGGGGCILADSMGLGKTLQAIALLCSLVAEQAQKPSSPPFRSLIVCPTSLKGNWKNEFKKWLGNRIAPLLSSGDTRQVSDMMQTFACSTRNQVLISSYEDIRRVEVPCVVDLLICDEGHRMKSMRSQTSLQLQKITSKRRLLLTGTPLQNNLEELYSCCQFACPGLLPNEKVFRKVFHEPILRGCRPDATESEMSIAREREAELMANMATFMLRRTTKILDELLPRKRVIVVHVELSPMHKLAYNEFCKECLANIHLARGGCLGLLTSLRRIVNTPEAFAARQLDIAALVKASLQDDEEGVTHAQKKMNVEPESAAKIHPGLQEPSNKLAVLLHIMQQLQGGSHEKVVVVSNSTAVLDRVGFLFKKHNWSSLRLDGSTPEAARTDLVEKFNKDPEIQAFLLSSKAGGIGLNLTGANRLIHFDPDWNPANDQQALSRIWRDGQTKPVFIYRLTGAGTVESHIIRRQLFKNSLAKTFVDGREGSSGRWTAEHIADILTVIKDPNEEADEENEQVESFIPTGSASPPQWLDGFLLSEPSLLLRKIELEEDTGSVEKTN